MKNGGRPGWRKHPREHAMAARGISSRPVTAVRVANPVAEVIGEWMDELEGDEGFVVDPYVVNCGMCAELAEYVEEHLPGARTFWIEDEYPELGVEIYHCVIEYEGKFYDAEAPEGVARIEELPIVKHKGDVGYHEEKRESCQWGLRRTMD